MASIEWTSNFSVKIPLFDAEHQKLIKMINSLEQAMKEGTNKEILSGLLTDVLNYTLRHFAHEEKLMIQYNFPFYAEHKAVHDHFAKKIKDYENLHDQQLLQANHLLNTLRAWLIDHICHTDQQYGAFLKDKLNIKTP